jgi:plasmid stability protein
MPDPILDDVPDDLVEALERRAALHGRSAEDEHRLILIEALMIADLPTNGGDAP